MGRTVASWWHLSTNLRLEWVLFSICRVCKLFCTTWFQVLHWTIAIDLQQDQLPNFYISNLDLIFYSSYVTKLSETHLLDDHWNILYLQRNSHFFRGSLVRQTDASMLTDRTSLLYNSTPDTSFRELWFFLCGNTLNIKSFFLKKIGIHSMQGCTATTSHRVTRKKAQKDYRIQKICLERTYS